MQLEAGTAQFDITPPVGTELAGWCFGASTGVADRLFARALVLTGGGQPLVLVTLDLIGLGTEYADAARSTLADRLSTSRERILIACSHTHSGPGTTPLRRWGNIDPDYLDSLLETIERIVLSAYESMGPATLCVGETAVVGICDNRRGDGGNVVDERMPLVVVRRPDRPADAPLALLYNFSCHPVAAHGDRNLISADFPGYAAKRIESEFPGALAMFSLGAAGDVNPVEFHRMDLAERYGDQIGRQAVNAARALGSGEPMSLDVESTTVDLPVAPLPPERWLAEERDHWKAVAERLRENGGEHSKVEDALIKSEWAADVLEIRRNGNESTHLSMEISAVRIGSAAIVSLPGELFVEIGMRIKNDSPFAPTVISQLTNGAVAYLPTAEAFTHGGYETDFSAKVYGIYMLTAQTQGIIEHAAGMLLSELASRAHDRQEGGNV